MRFLQPLQRRITDRRRIGALKLVRAGTDVNFNGAGSICDFDEHGDQLNRHYAHFRIEKGNSVPVQTLKGPETKI